MTETRWPRAKLADHVDLVTGFPFKSASFTADGHDIALVKGENVQQGYIDWDKAKRWRLDQTEGLEKYWLKPGDVILAMDRPWIEAGLKQACIQRHDPPSLLVQRVSRLRGVNGLQTGYLRYLIASPSFTDYIKPIVTGINVPHISGSQIKGFEFLLPPRPRQEHIASILAAYDDLIENNTRRITILEEMARRTYEEWFVRFRFPGHDGMPMVESALGLVPEGWAITELGALLSVEKGLSYKGSGLTGTGVPMVNLKNILPGGGFRRDGTKPYSGEYKPRHVVRAGDIVLANTDLTQAGTVVGSPAIVPDMGVGECIYSHHIYAVRLHPNMVPNRAFVYRLLAHDSFKGFAKGHAVGTTVLGMPKEGVTNFEFARPPQDLMRQFSLLMAPMHDLAETLHAKNANLRATRDLLLPKLISGELDVSEIPEPEALAA